MHKLVFFVPEAHLESVKTAVIKAGAGKIGAYEKCMWQNLGTAQYLPTEVAAPYQVIQWKLETAREFKVETIVEDDLLKGVFEALIEARPYEAAVYGAWKILMIDDLK